MDTFQSLGKNSLFAFGGPNNFKTRPIQASRIIKQIISDGNYIHSCIDYDGHLQFVKESALKINKPLKMILKCYLNYPEIASVRRKTIYAQIKRFKEMPISRDKIYRANKISNDDLIIKSAKITFTKTNIDN